MSSDPEKRDLVLPERERTHTEKGNEYFLTRRFYVYVANRVQRIRKSTIPEQWKYVPTQKNPADLATRPIPAEKLEGQPMVFWTTRIP